MAMADAFKDRLEGSHNHLKETHKDRVDVPEDKRFVGFDAYQKAIDSGIDMVVVATPPGFRPIHFAAAVKADKNVFMEKPVSTDANGIRSVLKTAEEAKKKGLKVGVGLQRHHDAHYIETVKRLQDGAIGDITSMRIYWNSNGAWVKPARAEADRNGIPDAQLVLLRLALRRSHRRAAYSQSGRGPLGQGRCRSRPSAWAAARFAPARNTAKSTTITTSNSNMPTARTCSANAAISRAVGPSSMSLLKAPRASSHVGGGSIDVKGGASWNYGKTRQERLSSGARRPDGRDPRESAV